MQLFSTINTRCRRYLPLLPVRPSVRPPTAHSFFDLAHFINGKLRACFLLLRSSSLPLYASLSCCAPEGVVPLFIYVSVELHTVLMEIERGRVRQCDRERERESGSGWGIKKLTKRRNTHRCRFQLVIWQHQLQLQLVLLSLSFSLAN